MKLKIAIQQSGAKQDRLNYRWGIFFMMIVVSLGLHAQKPNVLLIISDDLNTRIGPYMNVDKHTPNLDRLAKEGVQFTRAYCQYPVCGPSRASLMSGLYPERNGILSNSYKLGSYRVENPELSKHPSVAGLFREQGYFTARVSKIYHMGIPGDIERGTPGADEPDSWDFASNVMAPETLSPGKLERLSPTNNHYGTSFVRMILPNEYEYTQTDYIAASQAIAILENRAGKLIPGATNAQKQKPDAPFFLAVGLVRPHVPLIAPKRCFDPYPEEEIVLPDCVIKDNVPEQALANRNGNHWKMNETQQKQTIGAYMASVRFMDEQVGRLLGALDRLKLRDNTIVLFISDHGYNLGEHDCWAKTSLWEGSVRVPFIISCPGLVHTRGTKCSSVAELIDIYPTLTELCGLADKQPAILHGKSLVPFLNDSKKGDENACAYTVSNGGKVFTIRTAQWRYTRWGEEVGAKNEELYNHQNDPKELANLADSQDEQDILLAMRDRLEKARANARKK